jgi:hypothetical protein
LHNGLNSPQILRATRVVIYDDLGNATVVAGEIGPRIILAAISTDEAEFKNVLQQLHLDKTVLSPLVTELKPSIQIE